MADYRNLRADQKMWDELKTELDHLRALSREFRTGFAAGYAQAYADAWRQASGWPSNVPLTRTKDDSLTRTEGE